MPHDQAIRHRLLDRVMHWLFAAAILLLLGTGFLPVWGVNFDWVPIHWIAGLVFLLLLLVHTVRSLFFKDPRVMWLGREDIAHPEGRGKYSLAQKSMHHGVALLSLAVVITGVLMMVRIETPFWDRNPYWLEADTWGYIYAVHGLAAMAFISATMLHVYFVLRPEKRMYLRAIFKGRI